MTSSAFGRTSTAARRRNLRHSLTRAAAIAASAAVATVGAVGTAAAAPGRSGPARPAVSASVLGPNVVVFDPSMSTAEIQAKVDAIANQQITNQFGPQRYALLFKPGTYGSVADPLRFQVGFYTEVAGLGQNPDDVTINGSVDVYNQSDGTALDNFWRSLSNLHIAVTGPGGNGNAGCYANTEFWAVSQAAPMRRVDVTGNTTFMDYCTGPSYASGGFVADTSFGGATPINGSQQQFYVRNSTMGGWSNGVWNQVFSGDVGAPAQSFGTTNADGSAAAPYTTLDTTPVSREKPYLYVDAHGAYRVFVPSAQTNSKGTTWQGGQTRGRSLPLSSFYVAKPGASIAKINSALAQGRNLLLTPGVYATNRSIDVKRADTVVLGLGLATIEPDAGNIAMTTADVPGIDVAGIIFDAGAKKSPALLRVGSDHAGRGHGNPHRSSAADPTALQDVFFRIGGAHVGRVDDGLVVNSDHTILDDIWSWRADHGQNAGDVGWTVNTANDGVVVNGDDVTATGLFAEHYQKYNVLWNGERGESIFFQNELPYDAPDQAAWSQHGEPGYPGYKVANSVRTHAAYGLGSYIYTNVNPSLHAANGFEVPNTPGVAMHDMVTISLNKAGTIDHVIDGVGAPVTPTFQGPSDVTFYSNGATS
ncbi:adenylyl cyclase [Allobranchiibius sp. GilTou38]|uniref:adenylyl cyclase n=1 Tax=Allobranchiibius sp. GilTou38 TaxID=2815210 RepID=UPI0032606138